MIVVYKNDRAPFARMSAQFMLDKLNTLLAAGKTKYDIIMLLGHEERWLTRACSATDGHFPGPMTTNEVKYCFESSDIVIGASDHQFRRMNNVDSWGLSNPAIYIDSGQVWNTASTEGYLEFHVFDDTNPFVTCQYINADITSRILHVGRANNGAISIKSGHTADSQYPMKKVIDGAWTQPFNWSTFNIPSPPTSATCHFDTPTGNLTTNVGSTVAFALSASDPDGVERVKIYTNGTEVASDSSSPYTFNVTFSATGTYNVTAKVKDVLGNYTDADNSRVITVNSGTTTVPWVTNLTVAAAGTSITNAGLVVSSVSQDYHATVAAGKIFSQTPGGGTVVSPGSSVALAESLGPVPAVTLLNEGFEGDFSVNWATIEAWKTNTTYKHSGSRSALADNNANNIYGKDLNTASYNKITVSLWYRDDDIDADDDVCLYLYDGAAYVNVFEMNATTEDTWLSKTLTYTKASHPQYVKTNFKLRVRGNSIDSGENLWLDDVKVVVE
jgi:hypothetical protein